MPVCGEADDYISLVHISNLDYLLWCNCMVICAIYVRGEVHSHPVVSTSLSV